MSWTVTSAAARAVGGPMRRSPVTRCLGGWCLSRLGAKKAREGPENRVGLSLANKDRGAAAVLSGGHFQAHQRRSFNTSHLARSLGGWWSSPRVPRHHRDPKAFAFAVTNLRGRFTSTRW